MIQMKTSNHNTSRCWLIQLASVIFLSTLMLTPAYAKREQEPQSSQKQPKAPSSKPKKKKAPVTSTEQEEQPAAAEATAPPTQDEAKAKAQKEKAEKEKAEAEAEAKAQKEKAEAQAKARARAEEEAKARAAEEAKARAAEEAKTKARAAEEAKARAAEEAKARAEEEAKTKARAEEEAKTKARAAEEAKTKARAAEEAKTKARAEEEAKAKAKQTPPLSLTVAAKKLKGTDQILHVTVTNNSMPKGLDGCTLSVISDPPIQVSYQNTVGNKLPILWPTRVPPLRRVVNVTKLGEPAASQTFPLFLAPPNGCRDAKIVLCVLDKNGKDVANRVSVEWHADGKWSVKRLFRSRPSSFSSLFNTLYSGLAFYHLCKVCDIKPSTFVALLGLLDFSKQQLPPALTKQEILDRLEKMGFSPTSKGIKDVAGVFAIQLERARAAAKGENTPVRPKRNVLLVGPTGAGKTFLIKRICADLGLPLVLSNADDFTAKGYQGDDIERVFPKLVEDACRKAGKRSPLKLAETGVVVIDELDKVGSAKNKSQKDINGSAVQSQLLPYFNTSSQSQDAPRVPIPGFLKPLNTANILFIGIGAFSKIGIKLNENTKKSDLKPALEECGIETELVSRNHIIPLSELTESDFLRILNSEHSPAKSYIECLDYQTGMQWIYSDAAKRQIAKEAVESRSNARAIADVVADYDNALRDCLKLDKSNQSEILEAKPKGTIITITRKLLRALDRSNMAEVEEILNTQDTDEGEEDPNPTAEAAGAASAGHRSDERRQHASGASSQQTTNLANLLAAAAKGHIPMEDQSEGRRQTVALDLAGAPIRSAPTTHQVPLELFPDASAPNHHQGTGS